MFAKQFMVSAIHAICPFFAFYLQQQAFIERLNKVSQTERKHIYKRTKKSLEKKLKTNLPNYPVQVYRKGGRGRH